MQSRFIVVDYPGEHAVVDTATPPERDEAGELIDPTQDCDHGTIVWRGDYHDRKDLDAQWTSARQAEAICKRANDEAAAGRERTPPPSLELDADGNLPASTAAVAPGPEAQTATLDIASSDIAPLGSVLEAS